MWTYEQSTGKLIDKDGAIKGMGYAGFGEGKNNPAMQERHNIGPLPRGIYRMETPFDSPDHGPYSMHLTPQPDTEMFGRDAMMCHGDAKKHPGAASHGCMIQLHAVRILMWESSDHLLEVIA